MTLPSLNQHKLGLCGLPTEVLIELASVATAHVIEALGSTCTTLRRVARDPMLWRRLFKRDYAHMYDDGVCAQAWPHGDGTTDPWPDSILPPGQRVDQLAALGPPHPIDGWAPPPFARATAMGKDARWLYVAHALRLLDGSVRIKQTPATIPVGAQSVGRCATDGPATLYIGDVTTMPNGAVGQCGYGVELVLDDNANIIGWYEFVCRCADTIAWSVRVDASCALSTTGAFPFGERYRCETRRACGVRRWYCIVDGRKHGPYVSLHTDGAHAAKTYWCGRLIASRFTTSSCTTTYETDESGKRARVGETRYANGDRCRHARYASGDHVSLIEFRFSDRCPDPTFAGRTVSNELWALKPSEQQWACELVQDWPSHHEHAMWPTDRSPSSRLFRAYITKGLIGWPPAVQAVALERMQPFLP